MPRSNYWINSSTVVPGLAEFIEYEDADDDDEPEDKPKEKKSVMETIGDVMKEPIGVMAAQMVTKAAGKYVDAFAAVLRMLKQEAGAERRRGDGSE